MKAKIFSSLATVIYLSVLSAATAQTVVYDLAEDWSDDDNPNGVWSYEFDGALATSNIRGGDPFGTPPPIWGVNFQGWSKSNGTEQFFPHDWVEGDIFGHTPPDITKTIAIAWTAPGHGTIEISGGIWLGRDIGRSNTWSITKNNVVLTDGIVSSGDSYDSGNPFAFSNGSGGPAATQSISVNEEDVIRLVVAKNTIEDYVGVNLQISFSRVRNLALAANSFSSGQTWLSGTRLAFLVKESDEAATDLNGDGDSNDQVLHIYDYQTNTTTNIGLAANNILFEGDYLAFRVFENIQGGMDLNGDGDTNDPVLHVLNVLTDTVTNVGLSAAGVMRFDGQHVLFQVHEQNESADLNTDGDLEDAILHRYDVATGTMTNLGRDASFGIRMDWPYVAFWLNEYSENSDLNADGDATDAVLHIYHGDTGAITNVGVDATGFPGFGPTVGSLTAFLAFEPLGPTDYNSDGDLSDFVLHVHDAAAGNTPNSGFSTSQEVLIDGPLAAFATAEWENGNSDLNGDGDADDFVGLVLDTSSGQVISTNAAVGVGGGWGQLQGDKFSFCIFEFSQSGADLNDDGDTDDCIVHIFDTTTGVLTNTALASFSGGQLAGNTLTFNVQENAQGADLNSDGDNNDVVAHVYDLGTMALTNLGFQGGSNRIGDLLLLTTQENAQRASDLNNDGDTNDTVLHSYNIPNSSLTTPGLASNHGIANGEIVAFLVLENQQGMQDFNNDGDTNDRVLHVFGLEDQDADGAPDALDNCTDFANSDQADADGDGFGDACDEDIDNDGILNTLDNCPDTANPGQEDSNNNGIGDACEIVDTDNDGVLDDTDNCPLIANTDQADNDNDGIGDVCDADDDNDTVADGADNCPLTANTDQADNDNDGSGDVCDADDDNDTVADAADNCPLIANTDQADNDNDGIGDVCDADDDNDTVADAADNCPLIANTDQADNDNDGIGDVCDVDDDNDTVADAADNCPLIANTDQADNDNDGIGDVCDADDDNDTVADAADNCPLIANTDQADNDNDGVGDVCDADDDNDTVADAADNCPLIANTDQADNDNDGIGDVCDADDDNDTVADGADNCPLTANTDQADNDNDGSGDVCDADDDNDTVADGADNCPLIANTDQADNDNDGSGDVCDADDDNDTVADGADNCPLTANTDQADNDNDGSGDVCDADDDNDTVADAADNCPLIANTDQADNDNDGSGDVCDADDDNDTVADAADNCPLIANTDQADNDNDGIGDVCDADDDNDTVADAADNCPLIANTDQADTDNDGTGDACNDADDNDGDEWSDTLDNCPDIFNFDQLDTDGDNSGDSCDADDDNDGQLDEFEVACGIDPLDASSNDPAQHAAPGFAPTAVAGADQAIRAGDTVLLDGSGSFDDNTASVDLSYLWVLIATPPNSVATLAGAATSTPSFVTDEVGNYVLELSVTDECGISAIDVVEASTENLAPMANAGPDELVITGDVANLDGTGSSDPENDPIIYSWTLLSAPAGSAASLSNAAVAQPSFTPDVDGAYIFELVVSDIIGPGIPDAIELISTTADNWSEQQLVETEALVDDLTLSEVTSSGNQQALGNSLTQAVKNIDKGDYDKAIAKIDAAIKRTDGCALRGAPDGGGPSRDWITTCSAQEPAYDQLIEIRAALEALLMP